MYVELKITNVYIRIASMRLMAHMWLWLYLLKSPFHTLEERDIQSKMWWLHVTLICYSHLFCLDGKVQHMTPLFFLILFVNKVTTFHTHHQVCVMINQLFIIMTYCGCVNTIEFFFLGKYYVVDSGYPMMRLFGTIQGDIIPSSRLSKERWKS